MSNFKQFSLGLVSIFWKILYIVLFFYNNYGLLDYTLKKQGHFLWCASLSLTHAKLQQGILLFMSKESIGPILSGHHVRAGNST